MRAVIPHLCLAGILLIHPQSQKRQRPINHEILLIKEIPPTPYREELPPLTPPEYDLHSIFPPIPEAPKMPLPYGAYIDNPIYYPSNEERPLRMI
jgi:hypothetical protein